MTKNSLKELVTQYNKLLEEYWNADDDGKPTKSEYVEELDRRKSCLIESATSQNIEIKWDGALAFLPNTILA